jgi:uncharacterized membrane protein YjfL (UPF0719 family)
MMVVAPELAAYMCGLKSTVLVGLLHCSVSLVFGGLGIFLAYRLIGRLLKVRLQLRAVGGNTAVQLFEAACLLSLAILARDAISATFDAVDLVLYRGVLTPAVLGALTVAALEHLGLTLLAGVAVLLSGVWLFNRLTPEVDEMAEIRAGHLGPAIVLSAVVVALALLCAPGLRHALSGLIPLPELPSDVVAPPS